MPQPHLETPVAMIIFNRPHTALQVFEAVARARPRHLLLFGDGPRPDRPDDADKCAQARTIADRVDWDCQVQTYFAGSNLGCGRGPAAAITWVFEQVEQAIILEDDCVPNDSFFQFCSEMLRRYQDDERVMAVTGLNILQQWRARSQSYHFSRIGDLVAWATWRRAWHHFDYQMRSWPRARDEGWLYRDLPNRRHAQVLSERIGEVYDAQDDAVWDYRWLFAMLARGGLTILPAKNLVSYVGFGADATHTTAVIPWLSRLAPQELCPPYVGPPAPAPDDAFDDLFMRVTYGLGLRSQARRVAGKAFRMLFPRRGQGTSCH